IKTFTRITALAVMSINFSQFDNDIASRKILYRAACQIQPLEKWRHHSQQVFAYLGVDPECTAVLDPTLQPNDALVVRDTCDICDADIIENEIDFRCGKGHYFGE